jgi:hypothetical protein
MADHGPVLGAEVEGLHHVRAGRRSPAEDLEPVADERSRGVVEHLRDRSELRDVAGLRIQREDAVRGRPRRAQAAGEEDRGRIHRRDLALDRRRKLEARGRDH